MSPVPLPPELAERVDAAARMLEGERRVRVISHYDSDGINSAAVLSGMLARLSKPFHTTMTRSLDRKIIERVAGEGNPLVIFSDMGSGQLDLISGLGTKAIVLDHHKPSGDVEGVVHINPSMFGVNGTTEVSGATTSFLLAARVDDANWDLSPVALAGAYGDMQHLGGFKGLNLEILNEAVRRGVIEERRASSLQGRNVTEALGETAEPYLRGYSGRKDLVADLSLQMGIDPAKDFRSFSEGEWRRLSSIMILLLASGGCDSEQLFQVVSPQHFSSASGMSIAEISSLANACGRSERYAVGLSMALGDGNAADEARLLRGEYNSKVLERLIPMEEGIEQMKHIQCFRSDDSSLAGALCGLFMSFIGDKEKPTIAYSLVEESYKISARGTKALVARGLDLAAGLSEAAAGVSGVGGGHVIASGATIPRDSLMTFLDALDTITGKQLAG